MVSSTRPANNPEQVNIYSHPEPTVANDEIVSG